MASYLTSALLLLLVAVMHYAESATLSDPADSLVNTDSAKGYGPYGGTKVGCRGCPLGHGGDCGKCCRAKGFLSGGACGGFMWKDCLCIGNAVKPTTEAPEPDEN